MTTSEFLFLFICFATIVFNHKNEFTVKKIFFDSFPIILCNFATMNFNDITKDNWRQTDINVDSLWLINERDKSGKHANVYHGNFCKEQTLS